VTNTVALTATEPEAVYGPALVFDNLSMTFPDGTHALDDVSFSVDRGEFVTVVGPSGCGKSTLLRIASGLETHTGGTCDVDRNSIGYVFQDATLFPWRTVRKNVELLAELHGVPISSVTDRIDESLDLVNLTEHQNKYPKQLSGGMRMRTSLARSLVLQPEVFLFDEPFGALDEISRERLNDELLSLFKAKNFAGLFITHSIAEAVFLSTRILVMSARPGRIVADYQVPFSYPRSHEIRYEPEFAELSGKISHDLRGAHP
jgi:NitT/TauT family transport system ATP-binding protein